MGWMKDYLSFTKRDRIGIIILLVGVGAFLYLPTFFSAKKAPAALSQEMKNAVTKAKDSTRKQDDDVQSPYDVADPKKQYILFEFDPNTLSEEGFIKLGIPARTARTIVNYRNKGGKFRNADDIRKIYSLKKEDADRIIPYIVINNSVDDKKDYYQNRNYTGNSSSRYEAIDINTATVEEWKSLPGIGEVLSNRIIKFRERLGGFSSIQQVSQTYGLKDSTFQIILPYLKLSAPHQNKININIAFEKELMQCKEMTMDIAKAIVIYRKQNGEFKSVEDIKKIVFINEEAFQKIASCLGVQ